MTTYRFQEVRRSKTVKFKCGCGKRFQRTVVAYQTVNPFNRNADGAPKTYGEIWKELGAELEEKNPDPTCACGQQAVPVLPRTAATR